MYLLLTAICLLLLFLDYWLIGSKVASVTGSCFNSSMKLIVGFFSFYGLSFLIGFPCQAFKVSWSFYYWLMTAVFGILNLTLLWSHRKRLNTLVHHFSFSSLGKNIRVFLKNNWFPVIFILLFMVQSISNNLTFYQSSYDDFYYIGKIVNNIGSPALGNEDYFNGSLLPELQTLSAERLVNTFEITYGYLSELFHIPAAYFCRITMSIQFYLMFFLVYSEFAGGITGEKWKKYSLFPFLVFLIPAGALQNRYLGGLQLGMYDLWQFQNSAFYGGNIVRVLGFPAMYLSSMQLLRKFRWKELLIPVIVSVSLLSFSTIFVQLFLIYLVTILFLRGLNMLLNSIILHRMKRFASFLSGILFILCSLAMIFLSQGSVRLESNALELERITGLYVDCRTEIMNTSFWIQWGIPILAITALSCLKVKKLNQVLYVLLLSGFIICPYLFPFLFATCFNYFFVIRRTFSAIQFLIVLFFGIAAGQLLKLIFCKRKQIGLVFYKIIAAVSLVVFPVLFINGQNDFQEYVSVGSGISSDGWDFSRLEKLDNDMIPELFKKIGDFFNNLPYGNYRFLFPKGLNYDGCLVGEVGLMTASNRIELMFRNSERFDRTEEEYNLLVLLTEGDFSRYPETEEILRREKVHYIFSSSPEMTVFLNEQGFETEYEDQNQNGFYFGILRTTF